MKDGIYFDVIAIKDNKEYPIKRIDTKDLSNELINSMFDGLSRIMGIPEEAIKEHREKS